MALSVVGRGWPLDPFTELRRMQSDIDRLSSRYAGARSGELPALNVWTSSDGIVVMAQLPGITSDDIELTIQNDTLTIRGSRGGEDDGQADVAYHRRERPYGNFGRTIVLPYEVDADSAEAMFSDGVLAVRLSRPEAEKPRRINISKN